MRKYTQHKPTDEALFWYQMAETLTKENAELIDRAAYLQFEVTRLQAERNELARRCLDILDTVDGDE